MLLEEIIEKEKYYESEYKDKDEEHERKVEKGKATATATAAKSNRKPCSLKRMHLTRK